MSSPTGPVVDWVPPKAKPERPFETYQGDPPQNDGRAVQRWRSRETCNFKGEDGKKCQQLLIIQKAIPQGFQWDENHGGGQLQFDYKNSIYYKQCPAHGPNINVVQAEIKRRYKLPQVEEPVD